MRVHCHTRCARVDFHIWMLQTGTTAMLGRDAASHRWPESFHGSFAAGCPTGTGSDISCEDDGCPTGTHYSLVGGFGTCFLFFHIFDHPNWLSLHHFSEGLKPPTSIVGQQQAQSSEANISSHGKASRVSPCLIKMWPVFKSFSTVELWMTLETFFLRSTRFHSSKRKQPLKNHQMRFAWNILNDLFEDVNMCRFYSHGWFAPKTEMWCHIYLSKEV